MTKAEFITATAAATGSTKNEAEKHINAFISTITDALKKGDKVTFTGFGSFEVTNRAARTCRNPQTGADMAIAAAKVPKFKPGKSLKDAVSL